MKTIYRKINVLALIAMLAMPLVSCDQDELLDVGSETVLREDGLTSEAAEAFIAAAYDPLQWQNLGVNEGNAKHIYPVMWQGIRADDMVSQWATFWQPGLLLDDLSLMQPNNTNVAALWQKLFTGVSRSNNVIQSLEDSDAGNKDLIIAEAKFLRAFYYFELVRHFGGVPLITENPTDVSEVELTGRTNSGEVYNQVKNDLNEAIPNLLGRNETPEGRATAGAARTLLAKVHLTLGEYAEVLTQTNAIINSGEYSLEPNFADNFTVTNEYGIESIFEIGYLSNVNNGYFESVGTSAEGSSSYQMFGYIFNNNGSFGNSVPRPELIALYDDIDSRKDATFITPESILENGPQTCDCLVFNPDGTVVFGEEGNESQWIGTDIYNFFWLVNDNSWVSRASMRKYNIGQISITQLSQNDLNEKVFRYAEVLLMHAEASLFASGATAMSGQQAFDMVRNRAYAGTAPAETLSLATLKLERRKELATEGWNRFSDLVRWGDAATTLSFKNFTSGRDELLPIPLSEIEANPLLDQNPGY
ncbi:RagB/SusD family nutrient uptake outer membrane protein [Croceivirga thetidis]|uniref:RagB/SusD family nutrient uptake outer membrane protein n=1 Tax=Croceivirga thetidis TaxID=2721623 RepID=A0ABX1GPP8_9FLAO|nr:RagB/SusD family nutrient uptake outer membrane protein [Croceivirga thetidis]NKI30747.1 RagB/SusD family nutrient uptake outer membrane protein [Croceivirga thetidis]